MTPTEQLTKANELDKLRTLDWLKGYAISYNGEVWHLDSKWRNAVPRIVCKELTRDGYHRVRCVLPNGKIRRIAVHQLACEAFHGKKPTTHHQVRHLDGTPANNLFSNLAWGTAAENASDRKIHGTERFADNMRKAALKLRGRRNPKCRKGHDKNSKHVCPTCHKVSNAKWYAKQAPSTTNPKESL